MTALRSRRVTHRLPLSFLDSLSRRFADNINCCPIYCVYVATPPPNPASTPAVDYVQLTVAPTANCSLYPWFYWNKSHSTYSWFYFPYPPPSVLCLLYVDWRHSQQRLVQSKQSNKWRNQQTNTKKLKAAPDALNCPLNSSFPSRVCWFAAITWRWKSFCSVKLSVSLALQPREWNPSNPWFFYYHLRFF